MSATPAFPFAITASGTYLICAAGDNIAGAGTLVQLTGSAAWTASLSQNVAAGVEPVSLQPVPVVSRSTGYTIPVTPYGQLFGDTDSPVVVEVPTRGGDLYLTVTVYSGAGLTVIVTPAVQSVLRPAGASVFDLNFDATPLMVEEDLEYAIEQAVGAQATNLG